MRFKAEPHLGGRGLVSSTVAVQGLPAARLVQRGDSNPSPTLALTLTLTLTLPYSTQVRLLLSAGSPVHARARNGSTYAAQGSNPRLTQPATHTCEPRLGQAAALGSWRRARGGRARAAAIRRA